MTPAGIWFNDKIRRRIILRSATSLVGKKPTKQKRIKLMCTMPLEGGGEEQVSGLPAWLEASRDHIMRHGGEDKPPIEAAKEVNVTMGDVNLFRDTPTEAPRTQIDHFLVKQMGSKDEPETVLLFEMRTQYSTDLWNWLGQQSGEEFDITFESAAQPAGNNLVMTPIDGDTASDEDDEDEDDASEDEEEEEDLEAQRKEALDPKHDAEFGHTFKKGGRVSAAAKEAADVAHAKQALQIVQ